jgi:hypothetical protein
MRILPAIIIACGVAIAPLVWLSATWIYYAVNGIAPGEQGGSAVDNGARIDIEQLRMQIDAIQQRLGMVEEELSTLKSQGLPGADGMASGDSLLGTIAPGDNQILDSYAQVVLIAGRRDINTGLTVPSPSFLLEMFGPPREVLSDDCEPMTNPTLVGMLVTEDVGPIRVNMLRPAIQSIRNVFEKVRATDQDLYDRISTAGALCVRRIRGSQNSVSSHAFGLAVDLNIDGVLDDLGDGKTQLGLTILADFFQEEGWFWGASFGREDSMHFEVSRELLTKWRAAGQI